MTRRFICTISDKIQVVEESIGYRLYAKDSMGFFTVRRSESFLTLDDALRRANVVTSWPGKTEKKKCEGCTDCDGTCGQKAKDDVPKIKPKGETLADVLASVVSRSTLDALLCELLKRKVSQLSYPTSKG